MTRLVILADDLTGAADAAAHLAQLCDVRLLLNSDTAWPECDVIAVDTDTRYASPDDAAHRIAAALGRAVAAGIPVFKKIDSTLHGNVGPELKAAAAMLGTGERPALIVASPAFPAVGRTMTDGVVLVDGVPLDDDCGGSLPRRLMRDGIPSVAVERPGGGLGSALVSAYERGTAAVVVDAESDDDLKAVLQASLQVVFPSSWSAREVWRDTTTTPSGVARQPTMAPWPGRRSLFWVATHRSRGAKRSNSKLAAYRLSCVIPRAQKHNLPRGSLRAEQPC